MYDSNSNRIVGLEAKTEYRQPEPHYSSLPALSLVPTNDLGCPIRGELIGCPALRTHRCEFL